MNGRKDSWQEVISILQASGFTRAWRLDSGPDRSELALLVLPNEYSSRRAESATRQLMNLLRAKVFILPKTEAIDGTISLY